MNTRDGLPLGQFDLLLCTVIREEFAKAGKESAY